MSTTLLFESKALERLAERTEYEAWFLQAVYKIVEHELFPTWPDKAVYPVDKKKKAQFFAFGRANISLGDWRDGFLQAGAPLIFVSAFKLLDMFIEWVLEENQVASTFRFKEKIKSLKRLPIFPPAIESREWLRDRLIALYEALEPLRGTIIHDRHFVSTGGGIRVASTKGNAVGPEVEIAAGLLRTFALFVVSVLRYVDSTWTLDDFREKTLRHDMDVLAPLHGLPLLGQKPPVHLPTRRYDTVFLYSMTDLRLPFECPICGSDGFIQVAVRGRDGVQRLTDAYECKGCSTMFRERERFTTHRKRVIGADGTDLKEAIEKRRRSADG
jgi:hypothetical protein